MAYSGYNTAFTQSDAHSASDGYRYAGHIFGGHIPIWVRPPQGTDYCPWTGLKHASFTNWVEDYRNQLITYKLNLDTPTGTVLVWLPSLMETLRNENIEEVHPYEDHSLYRSRLFPNVPPIAIRVPLRKQKCPWTSLSPSSMRTLRKRYYSLRLGATPIYLPDLYAKMMKDAAMPKTIIGL